MGLSLLEKKALGDRSARYYAQEYQHMLQFANSSRLPLSQSDQLDAALAEYFNLLFMQGHPAHRGDKIIAAVISKMRWNRLPHSWRCLKGWRCLAPGTSRKAYPTLGVWVAIAC